MEDKFKTGSRLNDHLQGADEINYLRIANQILQNNAQVYLI